MVRSGKKTAALFLGGFALAQILRENGVISDDPLVAYVYSAVLRDFLTLVPDEWETWVTERWKMMVQSCLAYWLGGRNEDRRDGPEV